MNFTSAIVVIEELAKVDPSVSVLCDVHNYAREHGGFEVGDGGAEEKIPAATGH